MTELEHPTQVEWISQGVCHHNGLGLACYEGLLELLDTSIPRNRIIIDENWNASMLQDWCNRGGKTRSAGDDLVARL